MGTLNDHNLHAYKDKHNTSVLVETGTGQGVAIVYALKADCFDSIYSIETVRQLFQGNLHLQIDNPQVNLHEGISVDCLPRILKEVSAEKPILFWLDAHFPGADFGMCAYDMFKGDEKIHAPLRLELESIVKHRPSYTKDVFIIDDYALYRREGSKLINHPGYIGGGIDFIRNMFESTHTLVIDPRDNGYIILEPKGTVQ